MGFKRTIECYDCHQQVVNLKTHRNICHKSRRNKSVIKKTPTYNQISTDDTHSINIHFDSACRQTIDFYALLDVSSSMSGSRLNHAKNVIIEMFNQMNQNDRISIVTFDTGAYFKLKPRAVGQIRRQNELAHTLDRIFSGGMTAIWDAIWLAVSQIRDKSKRTILFVLTDGMDNSSKHNYQQVLDLVAQYPNISLSIIHVDGRKNSQYINICQQSQGDYIEVKNDNDIEPVMFNLFDKHYLNINISIQ